MNHAFAKYSFAMATVILCAQVAWGAAACPNPKAGSAAIAISVTSMGSQCVQTLDRARWLGFTAITFSPEFSYNPDGTYKPMDTPINMNRCLDQAAKLGFDIVWKPMVEPATQPVSLLTPNFFDYAHETLADSLIYNATGHAQSVWRAKLEIKPDQNYENAILGPFESWLARAKKSEKLTNMNVSISVGTELHRSLADSASDWNNLMWNVQQKMQALGIRQQVQVGIDPSIFGKASWLEKDLTTPMTSDQCQAYEQMLWTSDFYTPSIYGDYLKNGFNTNPAGAVAGVMKDAQTGWEQAAQQRGCTLSKSIIKRYENADYEDRDRGRSSKRTWYGEIGYGGSLRRSFAEFDQDPPPLLPNDPNYLQQVDQFKNTFFVQAQQSFQKNAPVWMKALLDVASNSYVDTVNVWGTGSYDLFGFTDLPALGDPSSTYRQYTGKDPIKGADAIPAVAQIRDQLQAYTENRCPGWQPIAPQLAPPIVHRPVRPRPRPTVHRVSNDCADCAALARPDIISREILKAFDPAIPLQDILDDPAQPLVQQQDDDEPSPPLAPAEPSPHFVPVFETPSP
jgi:hypothetical protein